MVSKKTLLLTSGILGLFIMVAGIQATNAVPASLPSYLSTGTTINGYKLVWYNNITVNNFENTKTNVTCWTTIWYKAANATLNISARIIAASLVNEGGKILNRAINLTKTDDKTKAAHNVLNSSLVGLSNETIAGLTNIWDLVIAILMLKNGTTLADGTSYKLTQPSIPKADHAALLNITGRSYFKHALFASKGAYMLLALDYATNNWTVANWTDSSTVQTAIGAHLQWDIWFFWGLLGKVLLWLNAAANWLGTSSVPESIAPASSKIAASANAPASDMLGFATGWAGLFGTGGVPGYESSVIIAFTTMAVVMIGIKVKRSRKE